MSKILIIIPAYNEEQNIFKTIKQIKKSNINLDYIVINDGSSDKTEEILKDNDIKHINLIHNLGIGGAVQTGYKYALENDYDIAIQFDGDGQHDVNYFYKLIEPIEKEQANMVIGSRFIEDVSEFKSTKLRQLGIKIISHTIQLVARKKIYDTTSGYRAIDKKLIKEFSTTYPTEYPEPVSTTYVLKKNYIVKEIAVKMNEREAGISSINNWKNIYYMINVILSIIVTGMRGNKK